MKKVTLLISSMLCLSAFTTEASAAKPFSCNSESFISFKTYGSSTSKFNTISLIDGKTLKQEQVSGVNEINSIGYNVKDNMVWGYNIAAKKVIRIDADKNYKMFNVSGLEKRKYVAADVSADGVLFLFSRSTKEGFSNVRKRISRVKLDSLTTLPDVKLSKNIFTADFAFNPEDGNIYFIEKKSPANKLCKIVLSHGGKVGTVSTVGSTGLSDSDVVISYFDKDGNFYFNGPDRKKLYKIDVSKSSKATFVTNLDKNLEGGDGARCANAPIEPEGPIDPQEPAGDGSGVCYAMSDDSTKFYIVSMNPGASPLPKPIEKSMQSSFNGEGSAYRAKDNKIYAFKAKGDDKGPSSLYTIDVETQKISLVKKNLVSDAVDGAEFYYDETLKKEILYLTSNEDETKLYAFDTTTWKKLPGYPKNVHGDVEGISSLAINPTNGDAYGVDDYNYDFQKPTLYKIDLHTGKATKVVKLSKIVDAEGLAFGSDGNLYLEDENNFNGRKLYRVSLKNGYLTPAAILGGHGDIEGLSCNGSKLYELPSKPFTCNDTMYFSNASPMGTPEGEDDSKMWLHKINRDQTPFRFDAIGAPFHEIEVTRADGTTHHNVYNALSYNPADNYMYALIEHVLVKIDSSGAVDEQGPVLGLPKCGAHGNYYAGSFGAIESDGKSYFYITSGFDSEIYKIDVDNRKVVDTIVATEGIYSWDVAADKAGDYLYYIDRESAKDNNQLRRVKIRGNDKGKVEAIGPRYKDDGMVDVIFCDGSDKLYVLYHDKGFYEVDKETGKRTAISNAPVTASLNDAAMCPLATVHFKPIISIDDTVQIIEGDSGTKDLKFSIDYRGGNSSGVTFDYATENSTHADAKLNATSADYISTHAKHVHTSSITVKVKGDKIEEADEQFMLRLSNIQGALYHDSALISTGTILDNDTKQNAFTCESNSYIFTSDANADHTKAFNVNFMDSKIELLREEFNKKSDANIRGSHINAIGYNVQDNYIYGWEWDAAGCVDWTCSDRDANKYNPGVVKIDKDFNIQRISIEGFDEKKPLYSGDVSLEGKYYVSGSSAGGENGITAADRIYVIDLNKRKLERTLMLSHPVKMADFAFSPMDNKIYAIETWQDGPDAWDDRRYDLVRIDPENGNVERLGDVRSNENKISNAYTVITFFDKTGNFYFQTPYNESPSVYKIDISKPDETINPHATFFKEIEIDDGGDGARCPLAPIENVYDINISTANTLEGDSGYSDLNVTVTLDRAVSEESGLVIKYKLISGTEKIDASKKEGFFTIPSGVTAYTASLPVIKGDVLVEDNKDFKIHLFITRDPKYKDKDVMTVDGHKVEIKFITNNITGVVVDDDACTFAAWDASDANVDAQKIHTKIVNGAIALKVALIDKSDKLFIPTSHNSAGVTDTKLRIVDASGANNPCSSGIDPEELNKDTSFVSFNMGNAGLITYTLPANQAHLMKEARIQFSWKDKLGWQTTCAKDTFAIRPNRYDLGIPSNLVAGRDFQVTISAKDAQGHVITDYSEAAGVYQLDINETNSSCSLGTITQSKQNFVQGVSTVTVKYSDVGVLDFKVREKNASNTEFAHIDAEDTVSRFISPDSEASVEVKPAKIELSSTFSTKGVTYGGSNYTFYADVSEIDKMSAELKTIVRALNENDQVVKNFKSECYSKDVDVNMLYTLSGSTVQANMDVNYTNTNNGALAQAANALHVPVGSQQTYTYKIDKSLFVDGVGTQSILMNFQRAVNDEKNPMGFNVGKVEASVDTLDATPSTSVGSTIFMYGRAHVPSPQTFVGRDHNITVSYEIYCDEDNGCNRATYPGFAGLAESEDAVSWFKLKGFTALSMSVMDYTSPKALYSKDSYYDPYAIHSTTGKGSAFPSREDASTMNIKVTGSLPHRDKIVYNPKHNYLTFNPADPNAVRHSFKIKAMPDTQNWLGKGDLGSTVDDTTSTGNGLHKLNW